LRIVRPQSSFQLRSKVVKPTKRLSLSNKLGNNCSSARSKQLTTYSPFQCRVRQSWRPQRDHAAAFLTRKVRLEATRSLIHTGRPAGRALRCLRNRRKNDRLLREPMRLLPIAGQRWVREKIYDSALNGRDPSYQRYHAEPFAGQEDITTDLLERRLGPTPELPTIHLKRSFRGSGAQAN
jgi:hypothetical protein